MNKDIENIYVDLKVRTSKVENKIFQIILDKIRENIENLDNIYNLGLNIELKEISESFQNIEIALKGLMGKGIDINYLKGERRIFNTFNYVTSYTYNEEIFNIFIPLNILNCFKKNTLEYKISLRTFFYLRKKAVINFFNLLIKDIEQNRYYFKKEFYASQNIAFKKIEEIKWNLWDSIFVILILLSF